MRPLVLLLLYTGTVFLGGALLAPSLYFSAQSLAAQVPALHAVAQQPFHRYVNRSLLALAVVGLWPLLRALGARSGRDLGLVGPSGQGRRLAGGLALGMATLAGISALAVASGARQVTAGLSPAGWAAKILGAAVTAAVVAVLEEILFRGAIFGALRKAGRWPAALVISSAIYALVHFFSRPQAPAEIHWHSGLALLPTLLRGFADFEQVVPGFFNLTLAGGLLALAYQRTGNLYFSIGLHAGWIFTIKTCGALTRASETANAWWWGTGKVIDGWLAMPVLALAWWILDRSLPREGPPAEERR